MKREKIKNTFDDKKKSNSMKREKIQNRFHEPNL